MECPDANALQDLMSGRLASAARDQLTEHLDACRECRSVLATLAREEPARLPFDETLVPRDRIGGADTVDSGGAPSVSLPAQLGPGIEVGRRLGRYVVAARLGAGAMGVVYRAMDPELGREVAIKLLRRPDAMLRDRLSREARAMAQVNHPNVAAVYDVGAIDGQVYVAMELVRGQNLRQWQEAKPRGVSEIIAVYAAAGRGLVAAHAAGVIHRDFKPDNVLIDEEGRPRVTDFGLAGSVARIDAALRDSSGTGEPRRSRLDALDVSLTQTGVVLGTPVYMSPEQFVGGNIDPRSDQWSFCVSLYEALFGQRPFVGSSWEQLEQNVMSGKLEPAIAPGVSSALRRIVLRGLAVRPGDRHATMTDLLGELGRDRGTPWRRAALLGGVLAAAFAVGLFADWLLRQRAEEAATQTFRSTGGQLERSVALRYQSFVALADASYSVPVMHKVLAHKDQADFGLGDQNSDSENLDLVHDNLVSADWISWAKRSSRATIAVGDYKGRLLFTSAAPDRWGADLLVLSAVSTAFDAVRSSKESAVASPRRDGDDALEQAGGAMVVRYDDPRVMAAQLYGPAVPSGLAVIFARALVVGGVPLGLFVQAIDGAQLLDDVSVGDDILLSLLAPDGSAVGAVPRAATSVATAQDVAEVRVDDKLFLVQARPLPSLDGKGSIASLILARGIDPGLSGLFSSARAVFAVAATLLLALASAAAWRARSLALLRRERKRATARSRVATSR
jgi:serine/threonine protein kinase